MTYDPQGLKYVFSDPSRESVLTSALDPHLYSFSGLHVCPKDILHFLKSPLVLEGGPDILSSSAVFSLLRLGSSHDPEGWCGEGGGRGVGTSAMYPAEHLDQDLCLP